MDYSLKIEVGNKYFDLINHKDDSGNHYTRYKSRTLLLRHGRE